MKHFKRAIPIVLALVMAFALSVSAWAATATTVEGVPSGGVALNDKSYRGNGDSLTVNNGVTVYAVGSFTTITVNKGGTLYLGYYPTYTDTTGTTYENTTVTGGIVVNGGTVNVAGNASYKTTITNTTFPIVTITNGGSVTLGENAEITKTFSATSATPVAVYVGRTNDITDSSAATFTMNGGRIYLDGDTQNSNEKVIAIYNSQEGTTNFTKGEITMSDIPVESTGVYNFGKLEVGTKATATLGAGYSIPVTIEMSNGRAIENANAQAETKIYELNAKVTDTGDNYGIYATHGNLYIESGDPSVAGNLIPKQTVSVSAKGGTALYVGANVKDWYIHGGYQTAVFTGTYGMDANQLPKTPNKLTGGRFVSNYNSGGAAIKLAGDADKPEYLISTQNYYWRSDKGTDFSKNANGQTYQDDVTIVDAVWELQYAMEVGFTETNGSYDATTKTYTMGVNVDFGAYDEQSNVDGYVYHSDLNAATHGRLTNNEDNKIVGALAGNRTLDLNGHSITGATDKAVFSGGTVAFTVENSAAEPGTITVTKGTADSLWAIDGSDLSVTVKATNGNITITGLTKTESDRNGGSINASSVDIENAGAAGVALTLNGDVLAGAGTGTNKITNGSGELTINGKVDSGNGDLNIANSNGALAITDVVDVKNTGLTTQKKLTVRNGSAGVNPSNGTITIGTVTTNFAGAKVSAGEIEIDNYSTAVNAIRMGDVSTMPTSAGNGGAVTITNYSDGIVTVGKVTASGYKNGDNCKGGNVTLNNEADGTITTGAIETKPSTGGTAYGNVTITNGKEATTEGTITIDKDNAYIYGNNVEITNRSSKGFAATSVTAENQAKITNNANEDGEDKGDITLTTVSANGTATGTAADTIPAVIVTNTGSGDITITGNADVNPAIIAISTKPSNLNAGGGDVEITNSGSGDVNVASLDVSDENPEAPKGNVTILNAKETKDASNVTTYVSNEGAVIVGSAATATTNVIDAKNVKITNYSTDKEIAADPDAQPPVVASTVYAIDISGAIKATGTVDVVNNGNGTIRITAGASDTTGYVIEAADKVTIDNAGTSGAIVFVNHKNVKTTGDNKDVEIINSSSEKLTAGVVEAKDQVLVTNTGAGGIELVSAKADGRTELVVSSEGETYPPAVVVTNGGAGDVTITDEINTHSDSDPAGDVAIVNSGNGKVSVAAINVSGTPKGDVTIINGLEGTATGVVEIKSAIDAKNVEFTNYSAGKEYIIKPEDLTDDPTEQAALAALLAPATDLGTFANTAIVVNGNVTASGAAKIDNLSTTGMVAVIGEATVTGELNVNNSGLVVIAGSVSAGTVTVVNDGAGRDGFVYRKPDLANKKIVTINPDDIAVLLGGNVEATTGNLVITNRGDGKIKVYNKANVKTENKKAIVQNAANGSIEIDELAVENGSDQPVGKVIIVNGPLLTKEHDDVLESILAGVAAGVTSAQRTAAYDKLYDPDDIDTTEWGGLLTAMGKSEEQAIALYEKKLAEALADAASKIGTITIGEVTYKADDNTTEETYQPEGIIAKDIDIRNYGSSDKAIRVGALESTVGDVSILNGTDPEAALQAARKSALIALATDAGVAEAKINAFLNAATPAAREEAANNIMAALAAKYGYTLPTDETEFQEEFQTRLNKAASDELAKETGTGTIRVNAPIVAAEDAMISNTNAGSILIGTETLDDPDTPDVNEAKFTGASVTAKVFAIKNYSSGDIQMGTVTSTGNAAGDESTIKNFSTGTLLIDAGVVFPGAGNLTIDGATIEATDAHGVNFTSTGSLTIESGSITGIDTAPTEGPAYYGLYVDASAATDDGAAIKLYGTSVDENDELTTTSATYNSVSINRTTGIYKNIDTTSETAHSGYDWAKTKGTTTTLLPRTVAYYLKDSPANATDYRTTWNVDGEGYRYTVVPVSHTLTVSPASASMAKNGTQAVTLKINVNGTDYSNPAILHTSGSSATATGANGSWTITKTAEDASTGTFTFTDAYGGTATFNANAKTEPAPVISTGGGGGGGETTITAKVSGDQNSVSLGASGSGDTATLAKPTDAQLDKVIGTSVDTGEVVVDMSSLSKSYTKVAIPADTVKAIEKAVTDTANDADELTIKAPNGEVTFDAAALDTIVDQMKGSDLKLEVNKTAENKLAAAQQSALKDLEVQDVYNITLTSGNTVISDFKGGSATVSVNYKLKADQSARGIVVWYVAGDGSLTEVPSAFASGKVTFRVNHFSNYVIAYDAERAAACPQDSTCPIAAFSDADAKAWYHDGVHWALENGVMSGMGDGTFAPNGTTTRAMVAQILWNLEGKPAYVGMSEYADVDNEDWFGPAVRWASAEGIVTGYANPGDSGMIFNPNGAVTREQLATMLYRYAQYKGIDVSVGEDTNILSYEDAMGVSTWAMAAMQWACGAGVVNGVAANGTMYLQPQNDASRAVVATMIARFCTEVAK